MLYIYKMIKRVFLNNIRSTHNVGSIFRTSDGAGVEKIYLGGYTPAPLDRFGRVQPEIKKTSLGATESVAWEVVEAGDELAHIASLKEEGFQIVSIEQSENSVSLYEFKPAEKVLYIFGNEIEGVEESLLAMSHAVVEIPMNGEKESLNVSVTAGVALFHNQT